MPDLVKSSFQLSAVSSQRLLCDSHFWSARVLNSKAHLEVGLHFS
jgi:hypothetical protein